MFARRHIISVLLLFSCLMAAGTAVSGTLSPGLTRQLSSLQDSDVIKVLVVLRDQVDVAALDQRLRADKAAKGQRHAAVVGDLQRLAASSQSDLLAALGRDKAAGGILGYTSHWLINAVVVTGTVEAVENLAARPDVLRLEADLVPELIAPVSSRLPTTKEAAGIGITPGIVAVGARRVWDELGIDGTGTLVGIIDTGVDVTHPAFGARWRGHFAAPGTAWFDAAHQNHPDLPVDGIGHGTHVMGTMTGVAAGDTIGVAPGAQWIATNGIAATPTFFDNAVISSLEFMTDPDGDPTTIADVPDVVQNSWGVRELSGEYQDCDSRWWDLIDNCEAAGVVLVWSAGNEGGGGFPGTIRSPADRATNPFNSFSVGSTSNHAPFVISDFSSRGPSGCGGPYAIKPEIVAPGDSIYSAQPGGSYIYRDGTSMAGPHVAGVVALMRQANPDVDVVTIKDILMNTAVDLGIAGEDNDYGQGLVDAFAAVQAVLGGIGTVSGTVTDAVSGQPVAGALVRRDGGFNQDFTAADGNYSITMTEGLFTFTVSNFWHSDGLVSVKIPDGGVVIADVALSQLPTATISGTVRGPDLQPLAGATIILDNTPVADLLTDPLGFYTVDLPAGTGQPYTLRVSALGLSTQVQEVLLTANMTLDFDLPELTREDFESGGFLAYPWQFGGSAFWTATTGEAFESTFSARSGSIGDFQTSELSLEYYVAAEGELSFWYMVSSETNFDFLHFLVDGSIVDSWSGEIDWSRFSVNVPQGNHTFTWVYAKDEVIAAGSDAAWIDLIEFPLAGIEPFPELVLGSTSVQVTLAVGDTATRAFSLSNGGNADLSFTLTAAPLGKAAVGNKVVQAAVPARSPLAKGEKDKLPTAMVRPSAAGGPDVFGYTWSDSDDPDGPVFAWEEISAIGTPAGTGDDISLGAFDLGFPMVFYGQVREQVRISTNGFLSFSSTSSPYLNQFLPDGIVPQNMVAPFWDDLDPGAGGQIYYWADPAGNRFIVQFQDVKRYDSNASETFQVILKANGSIVCQYLDVSETGFCTVGIENETSTDGLTVLYNTASYLENELAIRFEPPGFLPWVRFSPLAGVVPPGRSAQITLQFDASGLSLGPYLAAMNVVTNDVDQPTALVVLYLGVDETSAASAVLPQALDLRGAVPNPFNPQTEIHYSLPRAGSVSLKIHDVKGRLVRTLVAASQLAGAHFARWDGRDTQGRSVASGTYFARLVLDGETRVKAMALVR